MGEELLSKQNEQFVHGRDRAHKALSQSDLLTRRPDLMGMAFHCETKPLYEMPVPGANLLLLDDGNTLWLMAGDKPVGTVINSAAQSLRELMGALPGCQNMLDVSVHETVDFLGEFTIRVATEDSEE